LGSLQEDSLKSFSASSGSIQPTTQEHNHIVENLFSGFISGGTVDTGGGIGKEGYKGIMGSNNANVVVNPFTVTVSYSGTEFNEVKSALKSSYITAKVLI
jgi:hypothetical protein